MNQAEKIARAGTGSYREADAPRPHPAVFAAIGIDSCLVSRGAFAIPFQSWSNYE